MIALLSVDKVRPHSRSLTLIRPGIFIVARIVVFIVRAIMSKGNASEGLFSAIPFFSLFFHIA